MMFSALADSFPGWEIAVRPCLLPSKPVASLMPPLMLSLIPAMMVRPGIVFIATRGKEVAVMVADDSLGNPFVRFHEMLEELR